MAATRYVMSAVHYVLFTQPSPASWGDVINEDTLFSAEHTFLSWNSEYSKDILKLNHVFLAFSPVCLKIFLIFLSPSTDDLVSKEAGQCYETAGWSKAASAAK